MIDRKKEV